MDWLGFVKIKSSVSTSGELWNDLWASSCYFPSWTLKVRDWRLGRGYTGQRAGTEAAFGKPMKTSGMFILNPTPPLGKKTSRLAGRGYALRIVVLYPKKRRMGTTKKGRQGWGQADTTTSGRRGTPETRKPFLVSARKWIGQPPSCAQLAKPIATLGGIGVSYCVTLDHW